MCYKKWKNNTLRGFVKMANILHGKAQKYLKEDPGRIPKYPENVLILPKSSKNVLKLPQKTQILHTFTKKLPRNGKKIAYKGLKFD